MSSYFGLGYCFKTGDPVTMPVDSFFKHVVIIAPTGEGKSKLMELMAMSLIMRGVGLTMIDIEGTTSGDAFSRHAEEWEQISPVQRHNLHLVRFDESSSCSLNMGDVPGEGKEYENNLHNRIKSLMHAIGRANNLENFKEQHIRQKNIYLLLWILLVKACDRLTHGVDKAIDVLSDWGSRKFLSRWFNPVCKYLPKIVAEGIWQIQTMNKRDREQHLSSTYNMMMNFLASPIVRQTLSNKYPAIDIPNIVHTGGSILVQARLKDKEAQDALVAMLLTLIVDAASYSPTRHVIFVEEAQSVLGHDLVEYWSRLRKWGVGLVTSFTSLDSLKTSFADLRKAGLSIPGTIILGRQMTDLDELGELCAFEGLDFSQKKRVVQLNAGFKKIKTLSVAESKQNGYLTNKSEQSGNSEGGAVSAAESDMANWKKDVGVGAQEGESENEGSSHSSTEKENTTDFTYGSQKGKGKQKSHSIKFSSGIGGSRGLTNTNSFNWNSTFAKTLVTGISGNSGRTITYNESYLPIYETIWFEDGLEKPIDVQIAFWKKILRTLDVAQFVLVSRNLPPAAFQTIHLPNPFDGFPALRSYKTKQLENCIWEAKPCFFVPEESEKWQFQQKTKVSSTSSTIPKRWEC